MRIVVDMMLCESNALCTGYAPEVFEMNDEDQLVVLDETPSEALRDRVEQAARACPKQAIKLIDLP